MRCSGGHVHIILFIMIQRASDRGMKSRQDRSSFSSWNGQGSKRVLYRADIAAFSIALRHR
jgi:hypothetical protein